MKQILYLVKKELNILKKSTVLIACILTVFLAAFMGVFSVRMSFTNSVFSMLDEYSSSYYVRAYNGGKVNIVDLTKACGEQEFVCSITNITTNAYIYNSEGDVFESNYNKYDDEGHFIVKIREGAVVTLNAKTQAKLSSNKNALINGSWLNSNKEICVEKCIADELNLSVGDRVEVYENTYTVCGIFDKESLSSDYFYDYYYYIADEGLTEFKSVNVIYSTAQEAYSGYKNIMAGGFNVSAYDQTNHAYYYFQCIVPIEWALNAVAILLLCVIVVILYTLMTIFYRQRKHFICQLKLLGAEDKTILCVYLLIAVAIIFVVTVLSSLLGIAFNAYFVNLCVSIFEIQLKVSFNIFVPLLTFVILSALTALLFVVSGKSIKSQTVAQEIKCE